MENKFKVGQKVIRIGHSDTLVTGMTYFVTKVVGREGIQVSTMRGGSPVKCNKNSVPEEFLTGYFKAADACGPAKDRNARLLLCSK